MSVEEYIRRGGSVERIPPQPTPPRQVTYAAPTCSRCGYAILSTCRCVEVKARRMER